MASIIKNQILKHLSKFAKNLSHDSIGLSLLRGEGNLTNLELDENVLMDVLELPSWINLKKAVCNKVSVKIPWTKLKTNPICVFLDMVEVQLETCRTLRTPTNGSNDQFPTQIGSSTGKYGFAEKVLDGMYIHVNSVSGTFVSDTFHADIQIAQVLVQSKTPEWQLSDLRMCRVKDINRGEVITFKEVEWSTLRLIIDATESGGPTTTPIRLITNQGKVRVSLKKRLDDCSLVSSRLQVLLDDILWVLTDSQLKAVILHFRSLFPVIQKATELSKARASNKVQTIPPPRSGGTDPSNRPHNVKSSKELQMVQFFEKYDVVETSYHLFTRHIDLHLCDEMNQTAEEWAKRRVDGGAMQVSINGFSLDYYPFHVASSSRNHWEYFDEAMKTSDKWIHTLLAHFKQQYASTRKQLEKQQRLVKMASGVTQDSGHKDKVDTHKDKTDGKSHRESKASKQQSSKQSKSSSSSPQDKGQSTKGQSSSSSSSKHASTKQSVKLMSHGAVLRIRDFKFNCVQTGKNRTETQRAGGQQVLLKSDKGTFCLPPEMPSLHIEYLSFYFPNQLDFPVPSPVAYVQLNPVQFKLDYMTVLWLNQFAFNILQTLPDTDEFVPEREGRDHMDIRFDALMPKIIIPAEVPVLDQPDRPQELHVQISQLTATNCRTGTSSPRPELSRLLQHFQGMKLYHNMSTFPNMSDDLTPLPPLFWQHAYEPNFYVPKECFQPRNTDHCPNGAVPGVTKHEVSIQDTPAVEPSAVKLTTHSFRPDAVNDVWSIKIEQIWADFFGMASSRERPVPLLDPFTLNVWTCCPDKIQATSVSQSQSRIDVHTTPLDLPELRGSSLPAHNGKSPRGRRRYDQSPSNESSGSRTSSDEGNRLNSFEDLTKEASPRWIQSQSPDSFKSSGAGSDHEQTRFVGAVLSPLESETSTLCDAGSDHTLGSRQLSDESSMGDAYYIVQAPGQIKLTVQHYQCNESSMGDAYYIVQAPGQIKLTVQHYQVLFLLRLQQSLQKMMADIESDQVMYSSKPLPPNTKGIAFCCPIIEANLILNPIPDTDADSDSIGTSAHGEYTAREGVLDDQIEGTVPRMFEVGYEDSDLQNTGFDIDNVQLPKIVTDKPETDTFARTSMLPQGGPPGAVVMPDSEQDVQRGRSASIPLKKYYADSDERERRKSQENLGPNESNPIPTIQTLAPDSTSLPPHRSNSESVLNRISPIPGQGNQLSLGLHNNKSMTGSMTSLDDAASIDIDILSIDSDSSEGYAAAAMRMSTHSGSQSGLEVESESGFGSEASPSLTDSERSRVLNIFQNTVMQNSSPVPSATSDSGIHSAIPIGEQFKDNKFKLKSVSMVTFNLVQLDAAIQLLGQDSATKVQLQKLEREERGNMDYNKILAMPPAARKSCPKLEEKPTEGAPLAFLRFQSGPKAENLAESAGEQGYLQLLVNGLDHEFMISTITHISSLTADEIASEPMPMKIYVNQSKLVLQDDGPPSYPTNPGIAIPLKLDVPCLTFTRTHDGVFHITAGSSKSASEKDNSILDADDQDSPLPATQSSASLKSDNEQLRSQLHLMKDALNVLEHERSSLLSTLEHLQEELLTADRNRDTLQLTITDLQRQLNIR
ncbi:bridge-like lipid transfer protein family member 3B [Amphiura filiformis]|uniref:bridge-like lipid transfer protein family member 3B n=1 Tax=Amphiura filiformis TaxID=82378 RepID=UPI003B214401